MATYTLPPGYSTIPRDEYPVLGLPRGADAAIRNEAGEIFSVESFGRSYSTWRSRETDEVIVFERPIPEGE